MSDKNKINLVHPLLGVQGFDIEHADRLMAMSNNGGWAYEVKKTKREKRTKKAKEQEEE